MKPATAKKKGAETEEAFCQWLKTHGAPHAERRHLKGRADQGDVAGFPGICVEIKSGASTTPNILGWLRELAAEIENSKAVHGFVAVRPKGRPNPDDWYCVLPAPAMLRLLAEAGWCAPDPDPPYCG